MTDQDKKEAPSHGATSRRLRAWLRPGPENSIWGRGLSERSEFRSPRNRDWGKGTRRATPGRQWFWVLLPKQKDLVASGRHPACLHRRQPLAVGQVFTLHDVKESLLEQIRDGTPFSGSDLPVVDFPNRRHFGRCSREEHFLGHV